MRLLHTSDWHLGHTLRDMPRDHEHARFLEWLLETIGTESIDAMIVAGDIFDAANPPASALQMYYDFLAELRRRYPSLDVLIVGGNHDSPSRLDAPRNVLRSMRVHVIGSWSEPFVVSLGGACVAAVPFLRPADLPPVAEATGDTLVEGVRRVYAAAIDAARAQRRPGQPLLTTGHCYMVGGAPSEMSERLVLGGNQHALPADIFPDDIAYVALGHLHRPQMVGGRDHVRYSGSVIPLAIDEAIYQHQVLVVDLDGERFAGARSVPVPRFVEFKRLPESDSATFDEVLPLLEALEDAPEGANRDKFPFLDIHIRLTGPDPGLASRVAEALAGKAARLARLEVPPVGTGRSIVEQLGKVHLSERKESDVFRACYKKQYDVEPPAELLQVFAELFDQVKQEERS